MPQPNSRFLGRRIHPGCRRRASLVRTPLLCPLRTSRAQRSDTTSLPSNDYGWGGRPLWRVARRSRRRSPASR